MNQKHLMTERLIAEFTENYLEKLFYFCLKRTGGSDEAEDLASDIALNIITALDKGLVPVHFSAWVWQIARNRYSVWADRKHRYRESTAGTDIGDFEIICQDMSVEENIIRRESLSLLRRELSFISSDYRDILISYYIEDRKVQDIAASANLSEGTVKSKLFRARKKLKEGMDMAREFGTKSFKPENVNFVTSGKQPSGLPWSLLERKLPKNILLEASNNLSTIEELSIELGTAVPYMEEEVEILANGTLLKKVGDKYITGFFITDRDSRFAIYKVQRRFARERSEMIGAIVSDTLSQIRNLGVVRNGMSDNDLRWWAVIYLVDYCVAKTRLYTTDFPVKRTNGEEWGIMGYEQAELPEEFAIGQHFIGSHESAFWFNYIDEYGLEDRDTAIAPADVIFLGDVIRNNRNQTSFSASETAQWCNIENRFAHTDSTGNIIPDILVFCSDDLNKIMDMWNSHPLFGKLMDNMENVFEETQNILRQNSNPVLHDQLNYCTSMHMLNCRMTTIHDEVNSGRLSPPEDPEHSRIAMWMVL